MCGIAGEVSYSNLIYKNKDSFFRMQKVLSPRGPDQKGIYIKENTALIHTRLSVIDVKNGIQPMTVKLGNKEYTIVYNGELYNTEEIRNKLNVVLSDLDITFGMSVAVFGTILNLYTGFQETDPEKIKLIYIVNRLNRNYCRTVFGIKIIVICFR